MTESHWNVLRPLLNLEKSQILKYLDENNLEYRIDKTNFDNDITRNLFRNEIIPKFYKVNSQFKNNIKNTLDYFEELKNHIDKEAFENLLPIYQYFVKNKWDKFFDRKE